MMRESDYDVLLIGHFAVDKITTVDGRTVEASGGAVYYGALGLARLGYRVAIVTRLHRDDFWRLDEVRAAGIDVFATDAPQSAGMENIYLSEDPDKRVCKPLGFAGAFTQGELPHVTARLYLMIPILAGEIDLPILKAVASQGPTGLDVQGFCRVAEGDAVIFRDWHEKRMGLRNVRFLKADDTEAEVLTGLTDLRAAAQALAELGPEEIVLTHKKGVLVYAEGAFHEGEFEPRQVRGRTGRGDTCFTTYCAMRLSKDPAGACRMAAAVTSLKLETRGAFQRTLEDVEMRMKD